MSNKIVKNYSFYIDKLLSKKSGLFLLLNKKKKLDNKEIEISLPKDILNSFRGFKFKNLQNELIYTNNLIYSGSRK